MSVGLLTLEFLSWIAAKPRTHADVMEAWQSSCPRTSAWEDSLSAGLARIEAGSTLRESIVRLTPQGLAAVECDRSTVK